MAKKMKGLIGSVMGIVAILVSLAVGFGMAGKALVIPIIPEVITVAAGWIVVVVTIIGAIMAIISKLK